MLEVTLKLKVRCGMMTLVPLASVRKVKGHVAGWPVRSLVLNASKYFCRINAALKSYVLEVSELKKKIKHAEYFFL